MFGFVVGKSSEGNVVEDPCENKKIPENQKVMGDAYRILRHKPPFNFIKAYSLIKGANFKTDKKG